MKKITIQIVALVVLVSVAYMIYAHAPRIPGAIGEDETTSTTPKEKNIVINEDTPVYYIEAEYPLLGRPDIDARITKLMDTALTEFKSYPANPPESAAPKNEFIGSYYIIRNDADVVSIQFTFSVFTGGAHPNTFILALNVDPKTGKEITLEDVLGRIGLSLTQVADQSLAQLKEALGDDVIFPDGAAATPDNYSTFLIGTSTVSFEFQSYQVAPYAAGLPETSFQIQ